METPTVIPPHSTHFLMVRHGETAWNAERRLQGQFDIPLHAAGLAQARATAKRLAPWPLSAAYTSDLARARVTAEIILAGRPIPLYLHAALRERHFGVLAGLTQEEAALRHPELHPRIRAREPEVVPDGGESLQDFAMRVGRWAEETAARHRGQIVLAVTHGGVLDILHRLGSGKPLHTQRDFTISNAALHHLVHDETGWRIVVWDDRRHLETAHDDLPL